MSGDRIPDARLRRTGAALQGYTPCERGVYFIAYLEALKRLWGAEGVASIAAELSEDTRAAVFRELSPAEWIAEKHLIALNLATWAGPACRKRAEYARCIALTMDLSFGVIRRALLQLASPKALLENAPKLWREDHTHGEIEVETISAKSAVLRLREHPFVDLPQSRAAIAESLRHCVTLTRARSVTETHRLEGESVMLVRFSWV
jgi:uncharacterized protein (TIGR02265 family)